MSAAPPSFFTKALLPSRASFLRMNAIITSRCTEKDIIFAAITINLLPTSLKAVSVQSYKACLRSNWDLEKPHSKTCFHTTVDIEPCSTMLQWKQHRLHQVQFVGGSQAQVGGCRSPKVSHLSRTLPVASVNPNNNILDRANTCSGLSSINPFVS